MKFLLLTLLSLVILQGLPAANWPHTRGPELNGSSSEKNLPSRWSVTENIAWEIDLPGPAAATPVIWQNQVFVATFGEAAKPAAVMALDRLTGRVIWKHLTGESSSGLVPSLTTDGKLVVFQQGNGEMIGLDFSGKVIWKRNLPKDLGGSSQTRQTKPVMFEGRIFLQIFRRGERNKAESWLMALDALTGKTLWEQNREAAANAEGVDTLATPYPYEFAGRKELLVPAGDVLMGYDLQTGKELWKSDRIKTAQGKPGLPIVLAIAGDGSIIVGATAKSFVYAIKAGGKGVAWKSDREISLGALSPLYYEGNCLVLDDMAGTLSRVTLKTGQVSWSLQTPGSASYDNVCTGADGKVYCMNRAGEVLVTDVATGRVLNLIRMSEAQGEGEVHSVVAVSQGQLFIRTNRKLYCVAETKAPAALSTPGVTPRIGEPQNPKRRLPL